MANPIRSWRSQKITKKLLGQKGKIISWTKIFIAAPANKVQVPYAVALVELENGEKAYGQIVNYGENDLAIGKKVQSILRILHKEDDEGIIEYGLKFQPTS